MTGPKAPDLNATLRHDYGDNLIVLDLEKRIVTRYGPIVPLSKSEFRLLAVLMANKGALYEPSELYKIAVLSAQSQNNLKRLVSSLRGKLGEPEIIFPVAGTYVILRETGSASIVPLTEADEYLTCKDIVLNARECTAKCGDKQVSLTKSEYGAFAILVKNQGKTFSKTELRDATPGALKEDPEGKFVEYIMKRLRGKLAQLDRRNIIHTFGRVYCIPAGEVLDTGALFSRLSPPRPSSPLVLPHPPLIVPQFSDKGATLTHGGLVLDLERGEARRQQKQVSLSGDAFLLLAVMMANKGEACNKATWLKTAIPSLQTQNPEQAFYALIFEISAALPGIVEPVVAYHIPFKSNTVKTPSSAKKAEPKPITQTLVEEAGRRIGAPAIEQFYQKFPDFRDSSQWSRDDFEEKLDVLECEQIYQTSPDLQYSDVLKREDVETAFGTTAIRQLCAGFPVPKFSSDWKNDIANFYMKCVSHEPGSALTEAKLSPPEAIAVLAEHCVPNLSASAIVAIVFRHLKTAGDYSKDQIKQHMDQIAELLFPAFTAIKAKIPVSDIQQEFEDCNGILVSRLTREVKVDFKITGLSDYRFGVLVALLEAKKRLLSSQIHELAGGDTSLSQHKKSTSVSNAVGFLRKEFGVDIHSIRHSGYLYVPSNSAPA